MSAFLFSDLTPERILDALESIGVYPASGLLALNSYENRVYQFAAEDGQRYVAKFYRPERWSEQQIREEHAFSIQLNEADIPVVAPIQRDGESLFNFQGLWFCLFPSVGGRTYEVDNLDQLERVGQYLGRIHQLAGAQTFTARPTISCSEMLDGPLALLRQFVPENLQDAFFTIADLVANEARERYQPEQVICLHGDCHPSNILWRDGPMLVDLDDARNGPAVQDLWMLLAGDENEQRLQLEVLLESYEEFASFDTRQLALIEPLRAMRMIHYMGWLAKRWQDPAFGRAFPWFNTQQYWEQQVLALKEQMAAIQQGPIRLTPGY
ncbi:serine/threonine protein kinase [Aliagarivorans taiwanensis]|uniref:serine/threonine protein kinase n=1 Tax=Aliagarivorans taiwanensis TaxID=561966 RepID=UPI000402B20E|nr:serine/threonine protein kinase [Aliagarivorans taiwanensis]